MTTIEQAVCTGVHKLRACTQGFRTISTPYPTMGGTGGLHVCVLLCFVDPILGNRYGPGVSTVRHWPGVPILTLHPNYVAGYTGALLFLFERTQQLLR